MVPSIVHTLRSRLPLRRLLPHVALLTLTDGVTGSTEVLLALIIALTLVEGIAILRDTDCSNCLP